MPPHPDRVRKNYDDPDKGKPIAQQQCKDCGAYGCLIPVPHTVVGAAKEMIDVFVNSKIDLDPRQVGTVKP